GFRDFVFWEDFTPGRPAVEERAAALLAPCSTLQDVVELRSGSHDVGMHAASRVLNRLRRGTLDLDDPEVAWWLAWALTNSLIALDAAERIFDTVRPDLQVASNQNMSPWAEFYDVGLRKGVETIHWAPAPQDGSLLVRRFSYADRRDHFFTLAERT